MANRIPLSSLTSGSLNDGALQGQINESLFHATFVNVQFAPNKYVLRMDRDKGTFTDLSSAVNANSPVSVWGVAADLTPQDGFLIACDSDVSEIGLNLSTAGVGSWPGVEFWDSTDGVSFNRQLTGVTDNTNALKASGWRNILFPPLFSATRVALSPSPVLGVASRKWILVKPSGTSFTVTTAPIVTGMYVKHTAFNHIWVPITSSTNGSLTVSPTDDLFFPAVGDMIVGFTDGLPVGFEWYVFREMAPVQTRVYKYATNAAGTTFANYQGLVDPSNDLTDVPATQPEKYSLRFTPPADAVKVTKSYIVPSFPWVASTVYSVGYGVTATAAVGGFVIGDLLTRNTAGTSGATFDATEAANWTKVTVDSGNTMTITDKYMTVIETTAVTSIAPINSPRLRGRAKMLGNTGTSGTVVSAQTIKRVSITRHGLSSGSGPINLQLYNFTKQTSAVMVFLDTDNNETQNYDVPDMIFSDGDKKGLYHASGTRIINDIEIEIHI